jgi:eukaryotic-like serine/threonine-protein kinase
MQGRTIGRYRVLEEIGRGGMGVIFRAEDAELGRSVALKALPPELAEDSRRLERLRREARSLAALNHPGILTVYDILESEGQLFVATELVEGEDLSAAIPAGGLDLPGFLRLAIPLADAVAAAHEKGVVHRDLKPGNVRVMPEGRVKVLDFGLARLREEPGEGAESQLATLTRTAEGTVVGTPAYMAPEQIRGEVADERSDIFALGVILYEMATGRHPFGGSTRSAADLLSSILRDEPESVTALRPELPRQLGRILRHCLAKDPARRFQTAQDLRNQLEELREEMAEARRVQKADAGRRRDPTTSAARLSGQRVADRRWALAGSAIVALLAVAAAALYVSSVGERLVEPVEGSRISSLAVLPLANLMGDPEQDYFVEGMHEALTAELAKIGALKVISRTSAMRYRDTDKAAPQIARELGVEGLVEGSVLCDGDVVRITVQLIHGSTDRHLWAESYQRELRGILALQSEVARAVAREIQVTVTPEEVRRLASARPVDPEAYQLWLKGNFHLNRTTEEGFRRALGFYQDAIAANPSYAPAHDGMARAYILLASWFAPVAPREVLSQAQQAVERALALDPDLASAHCTLGTIRFQFEWDWADAQRAFRRAIALNPNEICSPYALFLTVMGRSDESFELLRQALERDPLSPVAYFNLAAGLSLKGHEEEALELFREGFELAPDHPQGHLVINGFHYARRGEFDKALSHLERVMAIQETPRTMGWLGYLHASSGRREEALAVVARLTRSAEKAYTYQEAEALAWVHMALGDHDEALRWLETAYEQREMGLLWLKEHWVFDPLRGDPRFDDLVRRMNYPAWI